MRQALLEPGNLGFGEVFGSGELLLNVGVEDSFNEGFGGDATARAAEASRLASRESGICRFGMAGLAGGSLLRAG